MATGKLLLPALLQVVGKIAFLVIHFKNILFKLNLLQSKLVSELNILIRNLDVPAIVIIEVANNDLVILHDRHYTGT